MRWLRLLALFIVLLVAAAGDRPQPGEAVDEPDDRARNARLLRKWKADPEHYARLQRDLQAFHSLSPERQQQLRQFDQDLHNLEPQTQHRLWEVLERYCLWYERLPREKQLLLEDAADQAERLQLIRDIKEQQWLRQLPLQTRLKLQDELAKSPAAKRGEIIARYKADEKDRRQRFRKQFESRPPGKDKAVRPAKVEALPPEVKTFVEQALKPKLSARESKMLDAAEGKWPDLVVLIEHLADRHKLRPLPGPKELWEAPASALPDVPDTVLREFALTGLTAAERNSLHLSPMDPESRERLIRAFFEKKPRELQRYRKQNKQLLKVLP